MSQILLVRHGQANSAARDEAEYDRLSDLGRAQARWLGAHLKGSGERFSHAVSGTLQRQSETLAEMAVAETAPAQDPRLNELEYFTLAQAFEAEHGVAMPQDRPEFLTHLPRMFAAWSRGDISAAPEPFEAFETRVAEVLSDLAAGRGPTIAVTSGGVIGMAIRIALRLDIEAFALMCLSIENTSVHRLQIMPSGLALAQFNACPHLEPQDRRHSRTHL
ncbi:Broad specificity phosphatase PhoE [Roseivivax lentus]|uniref:Broad specificity phosphatase PhoE n=1 Tax=Roseivivax lentus TaxID=633194 RepID=A0A1N7MGF0_9RHOB|nr:histidine phosphatase family protein [Roseivivax lentus]SIS85226.1 Broad specificity phosphatase PhoE [Roseivivax lentus]